MPPIEPTKTAIHTPLAIPKLFTKKDDNIIKITAEPMVPNLSAISGLLLENNFTNKIIFKILKVSNKEAFFYSFNSYGSFQHLFKPISVTEEFYFQCPYCWEEISMIFDKSLSEDSYIEDCEVCCNPIEVKYQSDGETITNFSAISIEQ